jgi:hypothetical protein
MVFRGRTGLFFCLVIAAIATDAPVALSGSGVALQTDSSAHQQTTTVSPRLVASVTSLSATGKTSQGLPFINNPFTFAVSHPDVANYFYSVSYRGNAVGGLALNGVTSTNYNAGNPATSAAGVIAAPIGATILGQMFGAFSSVNSISYNNPATQGAGTYSDLITIKACYDAQCAHQVPGSPLWIPVTYRVTGNPISSATFGYFPPNVQLEAASTSATDPVVTLNARGDGLPSYGAHVFVHDGSGNLVLKTQFKSMPSPSVGSGAAVLTATLKPGTNLTAGIYSDTLKVSICFDAACTKPAVGSPWTVALQYIVAATAGHDFAMRVLNIAVSDVVWDAVTQKLYALVPGYSSVNPNTITQIDPFSGAIERSVSLPGVAAIPGSLAISDDGQYLYAGVQLGVTNSVQRVLVSGLTLGTNFTLPSQQFISGIRVAPGLPHTIAIELNNPLPMSVVVYDDATPRSKGFSPADLFAWAGDTTSAFAFDPNYPNTPTLYRLSVSSSGLASSRSTAVRTLSFNPLGMVYSNENLYWSDGTVFSTGTNTQQMPFVMIASLSNTTYASGAMAVDSLRNRAYFLNDFQPLNQDGATLFTTLESFRESDRTPRWIAHFPSQNGTFVLTRWGTNGLALTTSGGTQTLVLISGPIVAK